MRQILKSVTTPIVSLVILCMGNALFVTYTSVRLKMDGYSINTIGYVVGAYFAGQLVGSYLCDRLIARIGHIRAYAVLATSMTVLAMLQAMFLQLWMWALVRFLGGVCIAGLFIVIESWLLAKSTSNTKGKVLSIYMTSFYAAQGIGQLLLNVSDPISVIPFAIVVILSAVSIIPISMTKASVPTMNQRSSLNIVKLVKKCSLGVYTCAISGLLLGPIYGLIPIFAKDSGMTLTGVSYAACFTILGGFVLQWPIGQLSDKTDRRKVISFIGFAAAIIAAITIFVSAQSEILIFILLAAFGGFSFTVYPLGIAHSSDSVEEKDLISITALLSIAYSVGSIIGPVIASYFMDFLGPKGIFIYSTIVGTTLGTLALVKTFEKKTLPEKEKLRGENLAEKILPQLDIIQKREQKLPFAENDKID